MNRLQKICFLWSLMSVFANLSMECEKPVLFESTIITSIEKRRQIIKDELQKNIPAIQQVKRKNYCYYGCLGVLAYAGAVIFAQNMNIDAMRINLFESCMGGLTVLASTAIIDVLHRRLSDNIEALVDYKIKTSIEKEPNALRMNQANRDLDTIYANYKTFHKNYVLPQTRFANWILKKFDLGRTKKLTLQQRRYINSQDFPLYQKQLAGYFGKQTLAEL